MVHLSLDNKEITVPTGSTILQAAQSVGIYIPALCSHPVLPLFHEIELSEFIYQGTKKIFNDSDKSIESVTGCELCIVELEGVELPVTSCNTEVAEGMKIFTDTAVIKKKRQENLGRILASHPHACLTCSQREGCIPLTEVCPSNVPMEERCCTLLGQCELQKIVEYVGIAPETPRYKFENLSKIIDEPLFTRDYNICINCGRCVRVCQSVRGIGALGAVIHDGNLVVGTVNSPSLNEAECRFCGFCVEVCPTGALTDKDLKGDKESALVPCRSSCPAGIDVPRYVRFISEDKFPEATAVIREKVPFPGVLGYVCFHPCEQVCRRGEVNEPISICGLKRSAFDRDDSFWKKNSKIALPTGKRVAIIGSGPAGLTTAYYLSRKGHDVTIFEAQGEPGGMMRYGIPKYRLPGNVLEQEINEIKSLGVEIKTNSPINDEFSFNDLRSQGYSALFLSVGARLSKRIEIKGIELDGVLWGLDFLKDLNSDRIPGVRQRVLIIGGGNVAFDVALSAIRRGAKEVKLACLESKEEMPAYDWEIERALEEGIIINNCWGPKQIFGQDGKVTSVELIRCIRVFDEQGKFDPILDEDESMVIDTDMVILAIGQTSDLSFLDNQVEIKISSEGGIWVNEDTLETSIPGIFAGGDIVTGPKSVIEAIDSGRKAAQSIDRFVGGDGDISKSLIEDTKTSFWAGKEQGFSTKTRSGMPCLPVSERTKDFSVIELGLSKDDSILEAKRCLQCDLRLKLQPVMLPPEQWIVFNAEIIKDVPEKEGVFQLLNQEKQVILIAGSANLGQALQEQLKTNDKACYFVYELDPMFTRRETELIQQYVQVHGEMPEGNLDLDELF